ncbi:exosome complex exonuclease RRP42 isoform X2 [Bicyclus anynana]|uniref:Ribosomal RNA-processing protein 42 n=1 Tax=Bicyclus anynana TaxID=110368 RepID=A0ABM3LMB4_BICAN|nr:exosome complex exonuclease RRP42 isoform X2 [Bicyclus anynana]
MAGILLSHTEKVYITHGVKNEYRSDGRSNIDYRPMELETDVVSHASGSARLRLANTDILVGVKTEIDVPKPDKPGLGKIEFFVDCSANATPEFEGRGGEQLANSISNIMLRAYQSAQAFNLKQLCIFEGKQCWKLYIDILVTLCRIGEKCVVDPTAEEESCSLVSLIVGVTGNPKYYNDYEDEEELPAFEAKCSVISMHGPGSVSPQNLRDAINQGIIAAVCLDEALGKTLFRERRDTEQFKRHSYGFLK